MTAQVVFTIAVDGLSTTVPVFVQPDSEQDCLLGSNVLPSLGMTVTRASGTPVTASLESEDQPNAAHVNLVQATTIPGMKGCCVKALIGTEQYRGVELLFEPEHKTLEPRGVSAEESLVSVDQNGLTLIPIKNFLGICVRLDEGTKLDAVRRCGMRERVEPEQAAVSSMSTATFAQVEVEGDDSQRYHQPLKALDLPESKISLSEMNELKSLLKESNDVFALTDSELGCTNIPRHTIDTSSHVLSHSSPIGPPLLDETQLNRW